jgi:hypothetical protein
MVNSEYADFIKDLADYEPFRNVLAATGDQLKKQRHMEYASRFMVYTYIPYDGRLDVEEYIDDGMIKLATAHETQVSRETFQETFRLLNDAFGGNAFRRLHDGDHAGRVGLAAFECIAIGISKNINSIKTKENPIHYIQQRVTEFWTSPNCERFFEPGLRGTVRIQRTISFGMEWFSQ